MKRERSTEALRGKVLLITGATGIAAATAQAAVHAGAKVFLTSRTAEHGQALLDSLRVSEGECGYHAADLTRAEEVEAAVRACVTRFGRIDALFNVAGISGRKFGDGPLHECSEEGWDMTLDTNAKSIFLVCRSVLRQMLVQSPDADGLRGAILNMASVLAFSPEPKRFGTHAYAASKGAILAMSKSMAAYYAPHKIRVNAIAPALVRTPMSRRADEDSELLEYIRGKQPLCEDMMEAEPVARAALFLLGGDAAYITGDVLTVDAGWNVSA